MTERHFNRKSAPKLESRDFWYIVGYGLGDGHIAASGKEFVLGSTDIQVIEDMAAVLGTTTRTRPYGDQGKEISYTSVCRRDFVEQLLAIGFPKNKSKTDGWLVFPDDGYESDFLRGLMDSDGCVTSDEKRQKLTCNFLSSSRRMIEWVQAMLGGLLGAGGCVWKHGSIWALDYGKWDTHQIVSFLYSGGLVNNRKRDKALALVDKYPVRRMPGRRNGSSYDAMPQTQEAVVGACVGCQSHKEVYLKLGVSKHVFYGFFRKRPELREALDRSLGL